MPMPPFHSGGTLPRPPCGRAHRLEQVLASKMFLKSHQCVNNSPLPLAERGGFFAARNHSCILVFRFSAVVVSDLFSSTVVSRRGKAAAFSERQRRVVHVFGDFSETFWRREPARADEHDRRAGEGACRRSGTEARRDRSPQTADAGEKRRHGQPSTQVFCV